MESKNKKAEKFSKSVTWKAVIIGVISLILLMPGAMILDLIRERQTRSAETINKINDLWSQDQTLVGPILTIPYETVNVTEKKLTSVQRHYLNIAPEILKINGKILPEQRHYGIYKSILYKSDLKIEGYFPPIDLSKVTYTQILWDEAIIRVGISDLRGVSQNPDFLLNGKHLTMESGGSRSDMIGTGLIAVLPILSEKDISKKLVFSCPLYLKGSNSLNFIPVGKTTNVKLTGAWKSPGFTGNFNPDHKISDKNFSAEWNVLHFNRNIPEKWIDNSLNDLSGTNFGVNLVNTVDHYQQTERSAKYAIMFIVLTFVVFFFVEIITGKKVHPIQYILVGLALILFYSLLLSISEQIGFGWAYLIASAAIIGMITTYANSIFKNRKESGLLALILSVLYAYLYVVIQIEDVALLIGSIGLFIILGIIMFVSGKINWYKPETEAAELQAEQ
jgi:inner membrane protein